MNSIKAAAAQTGFYWVMCAKVTTPGNSDIYSSTDTQWTEAEAQLCAIAGQFTNFEAARKFARQLNRLVNS